MSAISVANQFNKKESIGVKTEEESGGVLSSVRCFTMAASKKVLPTTVISQ